MLRTCVIGIIFVLYTSANILQRVYVPRYAFAGGEATVSCSYDLRTSRFYSLKWYHEGLEFYRYIPTARNLSMDRQSPKFHVMEQSLNEKQVTLSLSRLSISASGTYRCEIVAEHPSFRTESSTAVMTVLISPYSSLDLEGFVDCKYDIECQVDILKSVLINIQSVVFLDLTSQGAQTRVNNIPYIMLLSRLEAAVVN
ncbi:uncharacterized protein LOC122249229 [Penaeus japonicus]|uniref:uncharacterized protein LOC122249229 n=1 Tax=Penaeus japonicus TaxID=27405 RepID=UPI001C70EDB9|nr:uncharacterized protein LOC122249229 [Penaeus japonicus]